jgi:hypothetical protein
MEMLLRGYHRSGELRDMGNAERQRAMNTMVYIWRVLVNCFYVFVVFVVFDKLDKLYPPQKNTIIIIAVMALLYTTMRQIACGQALAFMAVGEGLQAEFADLKLKMGYEPERITDDAAAAIKKTKIKIWIDIVGLSIISLAALLVLFTSLP